MKQQKIVWNLLTKCLRNLRDAVLIRQVIETERAVDGRERCVVEIFGPNDTSTAVEIRIVEGDLNKLDPIETSTKRHFAR